MHFQCIVVEFIRSVFACSWIENTQQMPPTGFNQLWQADWITPYEKEITQMLLGQKVKALESDRFIIDDTLMRWMQGRLEYFNDIAADIAGKTHHHVDDLEQLFLNMIDSYD